MRTVYKYPLIATDSQFVTMPVGAQILSVQMQKGIPCLWALVETDNPPQDRKILIAGTGHELGHVGRYISTFQMDGGALVFHVFEA